MRSEINTTHPILETHIMTPVVIPCFADPELGLRIATPVVHRLSPHHCGGGGASLPWAGRLYRSHNIGSTSAADCDQSIWSTEPVRCDVATTLWFPWRRRWRWLTGRRRRSPAPDWRTPRFRCAPGRSRVKVIQRTAID